MREMSDINISKEYIKVIVQKKAALCLTLKKLTLSKQFALTNTKLFLFADM